MSTIQYTLSFDNGESVDFAIDTERAPPIDDVGEQPAWTLLERHQCPHCPIAARPGRHCPAALDIQHIVKTFSHVDSHVRIQVDVRMADRLHSKRTDVQSALRSLLGLSLATSACPVLSQMKGPGRLHMPFATVEETLFRMVGAYFLGQYLRGRAGETPDWSLQSLARMYEEVQAVNQHLKRRLDEAVQRDANVNAVVSLMSMAMLVSFSLDQKLEEVRPFVIDCRPHPSRAG